MAAGGKLLSERFLQTWMFEGKGKYKNVVWQKEVVCPFWIGEL